MTWSLADLDRHFASTPPPQSLEWLHQQSVLTADVRRRGLFKHPLGGQVLDVGAGLGQTAAEVALVPNAQVIGLDMDSEAIGYARRWTAPLHLPVTFVEADLHQWDPPHRFDTILARFVFQHLPDVEGALERLWSWLEPGGTILIEEIDDGYGIDYPSFPRAWQRAITAFETLQRSRGGDRTMGRQLGVKMAEIGFVDPAATVTVQHVTQKLTVDDPSITWMIRRLHDTLPDLRSVNLLTPEELEAAVDSLKAWLPRWVSQSAATMVWVASRSVF